MARALQIAGLPIAVGLCALSYLSFARGSALGYLPLLLAAVLLTRAQPVDADRATDSGPIATHTTDLPTSVGQRLAVGRKHGQLAAAIVALGVLALLVSVFEFHTQLRRTPVPNETPWRWQIGGVALVLAGAGLRFGTRPRRAPRLTAIRAALLAVLVVAVVLRFRGLANYPFGVWYDEASYGLDARRWMADASFRPVFVDHITAPHLFLQVLGLKLWGSGEIVGIRAVSAILGSLGVLGAYLLGRDLRGRTFGLLMAFLLAVMRWSINFSRIGMTGPELVTATLFGLWGAQRVVRRQRIGDAVVLGCCIGVGLYGYGVFNLQVFAIGVYLLLVFPHRCVPWRHTVRLALTSVVTVVALTIPVLVFVADQPEEYFDRARQVSIFSESRPADRSVVADIVASARKHVEMFHLHGDRNGRHNIPGEAQLDPIMGAAFVVGLVVAIRKRRSADLLLALSLGLGMVSGILSVSFEAPQSLRSIGTIAGVLYFSALGLDAARTAAVAWFAAWPDSRRSALWLVRSGGTVVLAVLAGWNLVMYFGVQRANAESWSAFSTADTLVARTYNHYGRTKRFAVSPFIGNSLPVRFLAPDALSRATTLVMPDPFPLRVPPSATNVILLTPEESVYLKDLRAYYPGATFRTVRPSDYGISGNYGPPPLNVVELSPNDISSIAGLQDGRGVLYVETWDRYTFAFGPESSVSVDNMPIVGGAPVELAEGSHLISVQPPDAALRWRRTGQPDDVPIPVEQLFHGPVTANGLNATFYKGGDWSGDVLARRRVPFAYWLIQIVPFERPYSVRYAGEIYAPERGSYMFSIKAVEAASLDIDGAPVIAQAAHDIESTATVELSPGWHRIEVRHQDTTPYSRIYLKWAPPGQAEVTPIERTSLCPEAGLCPTPGPVPDAPPESLPQGLPTSPKS